MKLQLKSSNTNFRVKFYECLPCSVPLLNVMSDSVSQIVDWWPLMSHSIVIVHCWTHHCWSILLESNGQLIVSLMIVSKIVNRKVESFMSITTRLANEPDLVLWIILARWLMVRTLRIH